MKTKKESLICFIALSIFLGLFYSGYALGQSPTVDCEATRKAWAIDPNLKNYRCTCPRPNQQPV